MRASPTSRPAGPGLTLVTGPNGSGKSSAARALAARVAGARLLSAESQQAFYEAQLAADESNFRQGVDTSSTVRELLGEPGSLPSAVRGVSARGAVGARLSAALHRRGAQGPAAAGRAERAVAADPRRSVRWARPRRLRGARPGHRARRRAAAGAGGGHVRRSRAAVCARSAARGAGHRPSDG